MRHSPTLPLFLLLLASSTTAQGNPDQPFREGDAVSLRSAPAGRTVKAGRALPADLDGDLLPELVYYDHQAGTIMVMWEPGTREALEVDVATALDFGVKPGGDGEADELIFVDGTGLNALGNIEGSWNSSLIFASWAGVQRIETYEETGADFKVIGLAADGRTLRWATWNGAVAYDSVLFTVPFPVLEFTPYDRGGTQGLGIALTIDGGLALYDPAGNLLAYHPTPSSWTEGKLEPVAQAGVDHDWIAHVTTAPDEKSQYLAILDETGVLYGRPLWDDQVIANLTAVDHHGEQGVEDGDEDLMVTFVGHAQFARIENKGVLAPDFRLAYSTDFMPPGVPGPLGGYRGMVAAADADSDGHLELLHLTQDGRLVVWYKVDSSLENKPSMLFEKAFDGMGVNPTTLVTDLRFQVPNSVPIDGVVVVKLDCYRQVDSSSATGRVAVWSGTRPHDEVGGTVIFNGVDLDATFDDGIGSSVYYYLVVRCIKRDGDGNPIDVYPAEVYGLHVSSDVEPADSADQYLIDMDPVGWPTSHFNVVPDNSIGDVYLGRASCIPALPSVWY